MVVRGYYIFGLQRSGTNFISDMLASNFDAKPKNNEDTWKHTINVPKFDTDTPTIIVYKNVYLWVESLAYRNAVDWNETQQKYSKCLCDRELRAGPNNMCVEHLAMAYRDWSQNWICNNGLTNVVYVEYDSLLTDMGRETFLKKIQHKFHWLPKRDEWDYPTYGSVDQSGSYNAKREEYYRKGYPVNLTKAQIEIIRSIHP